MSRYTHEYRVVRLVLLLLLGSVATTHAQDEVRFLHWMYQDVGAFASELSIETPLYLTGGAVVLFSTSRFDHSIARSVDRFDEGRFSGFFDTVNALGDSKVVVPAAGIFVTSLLVGNRRFQDAAFTSLQSLLYSQIVVAGMKSTTGRFRPYRGEGPYEFQPFSGHFSFPSGHTAAAFALTVPWAVYYPNVVTYGLVGASAGTAVARMARQKHWLTDVLTGGAIAGFTGYWLARHHLRTADDTSFISERVSILPAVGPNLFMMRLTIGM